MKNIGVFCSSHNGINPEYARAAEALGREIGRHGANLVYGGSSCGLMKVLADAVRESGGRTTGVVPRILAERHLESDSDVTFYCENLDDRKGTMIREADVFVALPGGIGTLDEIFTVAASNHIGYHRKKVILYNVNGFWNPLLDMMEHLRLEGMTGLAIGRIIETARTPECLSARLFGE